MAYIKSVTLERGSSTSPSIKGNGKIVYETGELISDFRVLVALKEIDGRPDSMYVAWKIHDSGADDISGPNILTPPAKGSPDWPRKGIIDSVSPDRSEGNFYKWISDTEIELSGSIGSFDFKFENLMAYHEESRDNRALEIEKWRAYVFLIPENIKYFMNARQSTGSDDKTNNLE